MMIGIKPPTFGTRVLNVVAGDSNPRKFGFFVRVKRVPRGHMNPGTWWECTDGAGNFWDSDPNNIVEVTV